MLQIIDKKRFRSLASRFGLKKLPGSRSKVTAVPPKMPLVRACLASLLLIALIDPAFASEALAAKPGNEKEILSIRAKLSEAMIPPKLETRLQRLEEMGSGLAPSEIPGALSLVKDLSNLHERLTFQGALIKRWSDMDAAAALRHLAGLPASRSRAEWITYAAGKLSVEPSAPAIALLAEIPLGTSRTSAISGFTEAWASRQPEKAFKWAQALPKAAEKEAALNGVWLLWPRVDPTTAARHVGGVSNEAMRKMLTATIIREWAAIDPRAALQWSKKLAPQAAPSDLTQTLVEAWAEKDPSAAADFALAQPNADPSMGNPHVALVLQRWIMQDPQGAAKWLAKQRDRQLLMSGVSQLMAFWAAESPEDAARWLESLPSGTLLEKELRYYGGQSYLDVVTPLAPDWATKVALKFSTKPGRPPALAKCLALWLDLDPTGARQWVKETGLPSALLTQEGRKPYLDYTACGQDHSGPHTHVHPDSPVADLLEKVADTQTVRTSDSR